MKNNKIKFSEDVTWFAFKTEMIPAYDANPAFIYQYQELVFNQIRTESIKTVDDWFFYGRKVHIFRSMK